MKKGVVYYLSATGNTEAALRYMQKHLAGAALDLVNIARGTAPAPDDYDFVGLATFTDWGDPPMGMKMFIDRLPRQAGKPVFLFNTCAGFSGKTLRTLSEWAGAKGFKTVAGFTLNAPESYPPMVAKGRTKEKNPSAGDMARFHAFINDLNARLAADGSLAEVRPKLGILNAIIPRFPRDRSKKAMGNKQADRELCTGCGICAGACLYQAIKVEDRPVFDEARCYGCWACYNHCPQKAIYTAKLRGKGHYTILEVYKDKVKINSADDIP